MILNYAIREWITLFHCAETRFVMQIYFVTFRSAWLQWFAAKEPDAKHRQITSFLEFSQVCKIFNIIALKVKWLLNSRSWSDLFSCTSLYHFSCGGSNAWFSMRLFWCRRCSDCGWNMRSCYPGSNFVCIPSMFTLRFIMNRLSFYIENEFLYRKKRSI